MSPEGKKKKNAEETEMYICPVWSFLLPLESLLFSSYSVSPRGVIQAEDRNRPHVCSDNFMTGESWIFSKSQKVPVPFLTVPWTHSDDESVSN